MKVLLSVDGLEFGGAEKSLVNLVRGDRHGHRFALVGPACAAMQGLAEHLPDLPFEEVPISEPRSVRSIGRLRAAFARQRPDVVQVTLCNPAAGFTAQAAALSMPTVRTIAVEQLVRPIYGSKTLLAKRVMSHGLADHVAVGDRSAREVEQYFDLPDRAVRTIYNGIPPTAAAPVVPDGPGQSPEECDPGRPVIGTVARLSRQKGLDRLLESLVEVPDARLELIGDGEERSTLEDQARTLGISDRIRFHGWMAEPRSVMRRFDVFVLPSREEAFPLTIVEAMLDRVPVVATDVGSVDEAVIDGRTGLLVAEGDVSGLAAAIKRVLVDDRLRADLVDNAERRALERFTAEAMADDYHRMWTAPRGRLLSATRSLLPVGRRSRAAEVVGT